MKNKTLFLITSLCSICLLTSACTTCPTQNSEHYKYQEQHHKKHMKKHMKQKPESESIVFYQSYEESDIHNVKGKMYTNSSQGGESEMGIIQFQETNDGLKMTVDLIDLRPGKTYTASIYQCETCNENSICCDTEAMSIDLPQIKTNSKERLKQSYIVRGLTASQLNNAKFILTRDGGYKAAWGTLQK